MARHHIVKSIEIGFIVFFAAVLFGLVFYAIHAYFGYGHVFPHPKL